MDKCYFGDGLCSVLLRRKVRREGKPRGSLSCYRVYRGMDGYGRRRDRVHQCYIEEGSHLTEIIPNVVFFVVG